MFEPGSFLMLLFWITDSNAMVLVSDPGNIDGVMGCYLKVKE